MSDRPKLDLNHDVHNADVPLLPLVALQLCRYFPSER